MVKGYLHLPLKGVLRQGPERSFFFFTSWGAQGMFSFCDIRVVRILSPLHLTALHQSC